MTQDPLAKDLAEMSLSEKSSEYAARVELLSVSTEILKQDHPVLWLALIHHRNTAGERLEFDDKKYLLPIYKDRADEVKIKKAVQMGITEYLLCKSLSHCDKGGAVFYVVPTQMFRSSFVKNRIDRSKDRVPYYAARLKEAGDGADSTVMKHFGTGTIKFVGSNARHEFSEFPASMVVIDEFDYCNAENLPLAKDRLQASLIKRYCEAGIPTVEGQGIDASFKESDQKIWNIECSHCNEWQSLDFFVNVVRQEGDSTFALLDKDWKENAATDIRAMCKKCGRRLDRLSEGEFVPLRLGHLASGYQLSHLFSPTVPLAQTYETFIESAGDETKTQVFYNSCLGLAYSSAGAKLSLPILAACEADYFGITTSKGSAMGVDVGSKLHVEIREMGEDGVPRIIHIGSYRSDKELDALMAQFNVRVVVMDAMPETRMALAFQARHGTKVWLCRYFAQPNMQAMKRDPGTRTIEADRTQTLDASHAEKVNRKIRLPKNWRTIDNGDFASQMYAPTRKWEKDKFRWIEPSGVPDHYRHADNYAWMAERLLEAGRPVIVWA